MWEIDAIIAWGREGPPATVTAIVIVIVIAIENKFCHLVSQSIMRAVFQSIEPPCGVIVLVRSWSAPMTIFGSTYSTAAVFAVVW